MTDTCFHGLASTSYEILPPTGGVYLLLFLFFLLFAEVSKWILFLLLGLFSNDILSTLRVSVRDTEVRETMIQMGKKKTFLKNIPSSCHPRHCSLHLHRHSVKAFLSTQITDTKIPFIIFQHLNQGCQTLKFFKSD